MLWSPFVLAALLQLKHSSAVPLPQQGDPNYHGPYRLVAKTMSENSPLNNGRVALFENGAVGISPVRPSLLFNVAPDHRLISIEGNQYLNIAPDDELVVTNHTGAPFMVHNDLLTVDGRSDAIACPVAHISSLVPGNQEEERQGHLLYWPKSLDAFHCPSGGGTKVTLRVMQVPRLPGVTPPWPDEPGGIAPGQPAHSGEPHRPPPPQPAPPLKKKRDEQPVNPAAEPDRLQPNDPNGPCDRPDDRPCDRPDDRPWDRPDNRPCYRPDGRPCDRPGDRPGEKPCYGPDGRPWDRPDDRPGDRPDGRPDGRPGHPGGPPKLPADPARAPSESELRQDGAGGNSIKVTPYVPAKKHTAVEVSPKPSHAKRQVSITFDPVTLTLTEPWLRPTHTGGTLQPLPPIIITTFTPGMGPIPTHPTTHGGATPRPLLTLPPIAPQPPRPTVAARENKRSPEVMTVNGDVYRKVHAVEAEREPPKDKLPRLTIKKRSVNAKKRTLRAGKLIVVESNRPSKAVKSTDTATIETSKQGNNRVLAYTSFAVPEGNSAIKSCQLNFMDDHGRYPAHKAGAGKFNVYEVRDVKPIDDNLTFSNAPASTKLLATYDNGKFSAIADANCSPGKTVNVLLAPASKEDSTVGWYRSGDDNANGIVLNIEYE
ncbi:hypothetical protein TRVA0_046S00540 [Trichomonascus vanleenenianus]|uniref:uncharacterized protein n=1 Tax=Trichomonascus vanleenenianus TaxID=2268995 RepID=UPI003ECAA76B